jgi:hypothetical protein
VLQSNQTVSPENLQKLLWLRNNRGVFARVARTQRRRRYTAEFIRQVFWGRKSNPAIRRRLLREGAPMGARREQA